MKISVKYLIFLAISMFMYSCEDTNENLVKQRGVAVASVISDIYPSSQQFYDVTENSYVSFTVDLPEGESVDATTIEVVYEGKSAIVRDVESFPSTETITAPQMLDALGITSDDVQLGTVFYIYVLTTSDNVTTRSQAAVTIKLPCEFDTGITSGGYDVVCAGWGVDSKVKFIADENDPYTLYISGLAEADACTGNGNTVKIVINPDDFTISGDELGTVVAADCGGWGAGYDKYTNYTYAVTSGTYSSCDGSYVIVFNLSVDQTDWGGYTFTFTR